MDQRVRFWKAIYGAGVMGIILLFLVAVALHFGGKANQSMLSSLGVIAMLDAAMMIWARVKLKRFEGDD